MQGEDPTLADVARQRRVNLGRGSSKLPFTRFTTIYQTLPLLISLASKYERGWNV